MHPHVDQILKNNSRKRLSRENLRQVREDLPPAMAKLVEDGDVISLTKLASADGQKRRLLVVHDSNNGHKGRALLEAPGCPAGSCRRGVWQASTKTVLFDELPLRGFHRRPGLTPKPRGVRLVPLRRQASPTYGWEYIY